MSELDTILKLKIIGDIGGEEGKNSEVKTAFDHQLDAYFAVKVIPKVKFIEDFGSEKENLFFDEAKMLYRNQHPNIVRIQHASCCDKNIYFTMPFYKKGSLNKLMNSRFLKVREIIKYSLEFLSGVHYIHTNNLLHFDIKPTNILINDSNKAMISDFGLSRYTDNFGIAKYSKFYTSHYPPECFGKDVATKYADIYQSGLTLYRMCNGNSDFRHQYEILKSRGMDTLMRAIIKEKFPIRTYLPHIPKKLRRIVNRALNPNPDDRYETILDIMNEISKIDENLDIRFYYEDTNTLVWEKDTSSTHYDKIKLINNKNGRIDIEGLKVNKESGRKTNISKITGYEYDSTKEAYKIIENYFKV